MADLAILHAPHRALLLAALTAASPPGARVAVDLACGAGGKTAWLRERCAPGAVVLGLDLDLDALCAARAGDPAGNWAGADAHALPLRPGSAELIWCAAALGLFADQGRALAEARRALAPGGALVVAAATERWVRPRRWAISSASRASAADSDDRRRPTSDRPAPALRSDVGRGPSSSSWHGPRASSVGMMDTAPPADDLGADLRDALAGAGLGRVSLAAYLLEPPGLAPLEALLPLADLSPAEPLAVGEPEPLPVLLVATGWRARA